MPSMLLEIGIVAMSVAFFWVLDRYAIGCEKL
jgi:hypothetical protein